MSTQRKRRVLGICVLMVLPVSILSFLHLNIDQATAENSAIKKKFVIGGLFAMTGRWSTLGLASAASLRLAAEDLNAYFDRIGSKIEIDIAIEDDQLDPEVALLKLKKLAARGIRVVIGPQSSLAVAAVKDFADKNDILLISQSSTAGSLALQGDNLFRFCPDDDLEGKALAALMYEDEIRVIVPIWRDDAGGTGLCLATQRYFEAMGGTMAVGVPYPPDTSDFSSVVSALEARVSLEIDQHGSRSVAVHAGTFDEITSIFQLARHSAALSAVPWYGSDGAALSQQLLTDEDASDFAIHVGFANPTFGLDPGAALKWAPIADRIRAVTGSNPDAFALAVYDAAWVAAQTLALDKNRMDFDFFKREFPEVAGSFFGTTGWTVLNDAGDRRFGDYDFWGIRDVDGVKQWQVVAHYNSGSGALIR